MGEAHRQPSGCDLCGTEDGVPVAAKDGTRYVRCRNCGFVYVKPRLGDPLAENARYYRSLLTRCISAQYSPRKQRAYGRTLRRFRRYRRTGRLLEIGSNTGGFLYQARQCGWQPLGVEPLEAYARYARQTHRLETIVGTLPQVELPEGAFDVIFANAVLEHVPSPRLLLTAAARALRPGGVLYAKTVNYECYTRRLLGDAWHLLAPRVHLSLFTPQTIRRFCQQAGLKVLRLHAHGVRTIEPMKKDPLAILRKTAVSALARLTKKGDRLVVLARRE